MKSNFILNSIFIGVALLGSNTFGNKKLYIREPLDTENNEVGIKKDEKCDVIYSPQHHSPNHSTMVVCKDRSGNGKKKVFENVHKVIGSATGTPGSLEFKNYIGSKTMDTRKSNGKPGATKRVILCDGPCEKREDMEKGQRRITPMNVEL